MRKPSPNYSLNKIPPELVDRVVVRSQEYHEACNALNQSARRSFEKREWPSQRETNRKRMRIIGDHAEALAEEIRQEFPAAQDHPQWGSQLHQTTLQKETTVPPPILFGFLRKLEIQLGWTPHPIPDLEQFPHQKASRKTHPQSAEPPYEDLAESILKSPQWQVPYPYREKDVLFLQEAIDSHLKGQSCQYSLLPELFYRNQHAYLLGLVEGEKTTFPFAVPFVNEEIGIRPRAFLVGQQALLKLFAFTRSYFLVPTEDPVGLVAALLRLMPDKDPAQLIINLGYQEWGKILIQQNAERVLRESGETLDYTAGVHGMVMIVFAHPSSDIVFKAIRDTGKPPKTIRAEQVVERYQFVVGQDRVGRFADAQLFENWSFPKRLFAPDLLQELLEESQSTLSETEDSICFRNILTERRMTPLDIFVRKEKSPLPERMIEEYGRAITEIAMSNIFPGDLLLKNFGVTDDHKVVFYDYDEVCRLSDCRFRKLPEQTFSGDSIISHVGPDDVFPEEFRHFLLPEGPLREHLEAHYEHLFTTEFWNRWKQFHLDGGFIDLQPYDPSVD